MEDGKGVRDEDDFHSKRFLASSETSRKSSCRPGFGREDAIATFCLRLEKKNYSLVVQANTTKKAWDCLQQAFQDNGLLRRFGIVDQFTSVKFKQYGSVYVDELVTMTNSLDEFGFQINDQWLYYRIL